VSAGPTAAGRNGTKGWSETGISGGSDALRVVLPPSRRAKAPLRRDGGAHSRAPENLRGPRRFREILTDCKYCATIPASMLNTHLARLFFPFWRRDAAKTRRRDACATLCPSPC